MITHNQYLDAVSVLEQYLSQLEAAIAATNQIIAKAPFLEQKAMLLSLKNGDKIEILKKTRHLPSVNVGDVLIVEGVVIEPHLRDKVKTRRIDDTFKVLTMVRRENGKKLLIKTFIYHYSCGEGFRDRMDILYDTLEFKKVSE